VKKEKNARQLGGFPIREKVRKRNFLILGFEKRREEPSALSVEMSLGRKEGEF